MSTKVILLWTMAGWAAIHFVVNVIDPTVLSSAISGSFMLVNTFLIWVLTRARKRASREEAEDSSHAESGWPGGAVRGSDNPRA